METPEQREARVARLEADRARRRGESLSPEGATEIAPGRGDLNRSSVMWGLGTDFPVFPELFMVGGRPVSFAKLFQTQPWIAAAVMRMLTWAIRVPLKSYLKTGPDSKERLHPGDHPIATAIHQPWERGCQAGLVQNLLGPVLIHGNSLTEVMDGAGTRIEFKPKDWRFSLPLVPFRDELVGFKFDTDQPAFAREVSIDSVLHVAWWSPAGPLGTSPLQQLGTTLNIEDAAQRHQKAMFKNGARPPSAIEASEEFLGLERTEREALLKQLREDIDRLYSGPDNSGRPALLPPGLEWKPVGHTAVEAALIDQRRVAREEVCGVYLIPPPMLGILDKATYSNIEVQREMVYTDCLGPPLVLIEQMINAQVIRGLLREDDVFVEFDFAGALRGDRLKEIEALRQAIGSALLTPNEGRGILNYQRSDQDEMDQFYLPFNNLAPIGSPPMPRRVTLPPMQSPDGIGGESDGKRLHVRSRDADYDLIYD